MSFNAMAWASTKDCKSPLSKVILLMLANHTNNSTGQCNPSHKTLAKECSMSIAAVKVHLKKLEELGYIKVIHRYKENKNLSNQYELAFHELAFKQKENEEQESSQNLPPRERLGETSGGSNFDELRRQYLLEREANSECRGGQNLTTRGQILTGDRSSDSLQGVMR